MSMRILINSPAECRVPERGLRRTPELRGYPAPRGRGNRLASARWFVPWESLDFYRKWSKASSDPAEMKGPYLDPLNPQTMYSPALLNLFRFILQSPVYVKRLKRHYRMFRDSVEKGHALRDRLKTNRLENKRRRLRDPKR